MGFWNNSERISATFSVDRKLSCNNRGLLVDNNPLRTSNTTKKRNDIPFHFSKTPPPIDRLSSFAALRKKVFTNPVHQEAGEPKWEHPGPLGERIFSRWNLKHCCDTKSSEGSRPNEDNRYEKAPRGHQDPQLCIECTSTSAMDGLLSGSWPLAAQNAAAECLLHFSRTIRNHNLGITTPSHLCAKGVGRELPFHYEEPYL